MVVSLFRASIVLASLGVAGYLAGEHYRQRDWVPWFQARKGELVSAVESAPEPHGRGSVRRVQLEDSRGLRVNATLKLPPETAWPAPAIVTLGGLRTSREVLGFLDDTGDFVVLAADYPYDGKRSGLSAVEFLTALPEIHTAILETVPGLMLAVDHLYARPEVDRERVVLVAGSLGALFGPAAAAADGRIAGLALLFGAGDIPELVSCALDVPAPLHAPATWAAATLLSPLEPLKYVGRVSPRPILLLNGTEDERLPEHCARRLQEAAGDPKTVRWMSLAHVTVRQEEFRQQVLDELRAWLAEIDHLPAIRSDPTGM